MAWFLKHFDKLKIMKRIIFGLFFILISLSTTSFAGNKKGISYSYPAGRDSIVEAGNTLMNKQIASIFDRVNEINQIDKSKLNSAEKLQLKSELKNDIIVVRHQHARYIYFSLGAVILVIVLLIIIL